MAKDMQSPCIEAGCNQLAPPGRSRCDAHYKVQSDEKNRRRWSEATPTGPAAQLRSQLKMAGAWKCARCDGFRLAHDLEVDHIDELADGGEDRWGNLQILCKPCHQGKTTEAAKIRRA